MLTIDIPIRDPKKPPVLTFPDRCVNCGNPRARTMPVRLNTGAQRRGQMVEVAFDVPLCGECAAKEDRIGNVTWIPFFLVGLLTCGVVFVPVLLLSPQGTTTPQAVSMPYILGAVAGMIAGMTLGTLVEFGLKALLAPFYGALLMKRPLTVFSVLRDSVDLIGLSTRFADGRKTLKITFENDEIAREFLALNPQENG